MHAGATLRPRLRVVWNDKQTSTIIAVSRRTVRAQRSICVGVVCCRRVALDYGTLRTDHRVVAVGGREQHLGWAELGDRPTVDTNH